MLQLSKITENYEETVRALLKRKLDEKALRNTFDLLIELNISRKKNQQENDDMKSRLKDMSERIGALYKSGDSSAAEKLKEEVNNIKTRIKTLDEEHKTITKQINDLLIDIPNIPNDIVPEGKGEQDNLIVKNWEKPLPDLSGWGLPHWELAKKYDLIDFELGAFITGSGFPLFRGKGAKLVRALINYFLSEADRAGYEEIMPPLLVNEDSALATGQLPDKEGQMYFVEKDKLYLIPTAEVPLTNIYRERILQENELPVRISGHTPCFRREAGSYGAHVKGLNRVHQFDKIEIVQVTRPEDSYDALEEMVKHVENLLINLELPYRIVCLCGADLGFTSALTYDFEVYSSGQDRWLEVSSVSNFESFQSNRLKLRYKTKEGKTSFAHTLNGSALALARIVAAILENNQTPEGIIIPKALNNYLNFQIIN